MQTRMCVGVRLTNLMTCQVCDGVQEMPPQNVMPWKLRKQQKLEGPSDLLSLLSHLKWDIEMNILLTPSSLKQTIKPRTVTLIFSFPLNTLTYQVSCSIPKGKECHTETEQIGLPKFPLLDHTFFFLQSYFCTAVHNNTHIFPFLWFFISEGTLAT